MVLEATILCLDNSEYVRNSDYAPTRLQVRAYAGDIDSFSSRVRSTLRDDLRCPARCTR